MARAECIQIQCDRCRELELIPKSEATPEGGAPAFQASFGEEKLLYHDLCTRCRKTVGNLFKQMKEWTRDRKETLVGSSGPLVGPGQAAPMNVPPTLSPPKPHSGSNGSAKP